MNKLVDAHQRDVYSFAYYFLGDREDAEDVTQEVMVRLWRNQEKIDKDGMRTWVRRVTRNVCIDAYRRKRSIRNRISTDSESLSLLHATGSQPSPDTSSDTDWLRDRLNEELQHLNEPYKSIVIYREIHGMKYDEIAKAVDLPLNTTRVYLMRGRRMLRTALQPVWEEFNDG